jgi:alpha-beta hydrolase superfamily lysophospholipase
MDFNVELSNGQVLRGFIQVPCEEPAGVILLVHGIGEHIDRYHYWADSFRKENFAFAALDLPGHGKSEGGRGKIKKYSQVYELIEILINTAKKTLPGVPVYLYGHSMGGGIVLDYTLRFNPGVKAVIATSSWLRLSFEPPKIKMILSEVLKAVYPGLVQTSGLVNDYLSHDKSVVDAYNNDPMVHDKISVAYFAGASSSATYALTHARELKVPVLLLHGSDDMICSPEGSREFASKTRLAELKIWDGGYHELHNETFKEDVFRFILNWIKKPKRNGA